MGEAAVATIGIRVSDVTGQNKYRAPAVPRDSTVGELIQALLANMGLSRHDHEGRPLQYRARLEREARHLNGSERVADALRDEDHVVLQPNVDAGGA